MHIHKRMHMLVTDKHRLNILHTKISCIYCIFISACLVSWENYPGQNPAVVWPYFWLVQLTLEQLCPFQNNRTGGENVYIYSPIRSEHTGLLHHYAIRLHYGIWPLLWRMKKPCVGLWLSVFVCGCASSHYLLLPAPGDSAPSLHLSSWLATICLSTSSSLVSRSNWSSCK